MEKRQNVVLQCSRPNDRKRIQPVVQYGKASKMYSKLIKVKLQHNLTSYTKPLSLHGILISK